MQVVINVDETQFKALMEESLTEIPKEKVHEIILEGIRTHITPQIIENMFVCSNYWGSAYPSSYLQEVIRTHIPDDTFQPLVDDIVNNLKDNYDNIIKEAIIDTLVGGMANRACFESAVRDTLMSLRSQESY